MYQPTAALRLTQYWPRRYTLILLSFAATFICYMDRVNISVAIIPMSAELGWDPRTQAAVLSAFFVGYLVTQVIGGRLADRFGGKIVLAAGVLSWSFFTMVTPWAALGGLTALLAAPPATICSRSCAAIVGCRSGSAWTRVCHTSHHKTPTAPNE